MRRNVLIALILLSSGLMGFIVSLYQHQATPRPNMLDDVPVIQTFHSPALFVKQIEHDKDAGRKIFKEFCSACHDKNPQIDLPAPRLNEKAKWDTIRKLQMPVLLKITINGAGAMPARGGCFECSDEQLSKAIQYMLDNSH